jgi:hypothetical protein
VFAIGRLKRAKSHPLAPIAITLHCEGGAAGPALQQPIDNIETALSGMISAVTQSRGMSLALCEVLEKE